MKKNKLTKGEKMLYSMAFIGFVFTLALQIFATALVGNLNMKVEALRYENATEEKKVESLAMKVNELTAFDKVKDVVKDMGLAYNNNNIIVIDNE